MQVTGMLYGSRMLQFVGFPAAEVLGSDASEDEIKRTYRLLVRENHPDSLIARGVPAEFIRLANDKLAAINGAYAKIRHQRQIEGT